MYVDEAVVVGVSVGVAVDVAVGVAEGFPFGQGGWSGPTFHDVLLITNSLPSMYSKPWGLAQLR